VAWATEALDQVRRDMVTRLRAGGHNDQATALKHGELSTDEVRARVLARYRR
jgi:hypothetical protein